MPHKFPAKFDSVRRILRRSHQRRVLVLGAFMIPFLAGIVTLGKLAIPLWLVLIPAILGFAVFILGLVFVNSLDRKESVTLGFVCPLCGAGLYCATLNRFWIHGECPHCKQPIFVELHEQVA
jgi:hypothetical protein